MSIDVAHYHGWHGTLRSPWRASLTIVRVAMIQIFRRKAYWLVLALGLLHFLLVWGLIYFVNQADRPPEARRAVLAPLGFIASRTGAAENGYLAFMERQCIPVVILLAFSGSLLVGGDFRSGALPFYLSRRIDRRHYLVGKLLAIGVVVSLLTTVPAVLLYLEFGMLGPSLRYWLDNWRLLAAVLVYGLVLAVVLSIWLASLSAWLQRVAPIAITWATLFILPIGLRQLLTRDKYAYVNLIDPWRDIHFAGRLGFGGLKDGEERQFALAAAAVLAVTCIAALAALVRRVRAVDVVE